MKQDANRPWRKTRFWTALLLLAATGAFAAAPAQAGTGGFSAESGGEAQAAEIAFAPVQWAGATWYGPGLYGHQTACGQMLLPGTIGAAHRNLPCGTTVKFSYCGRSIVTQVIDRGPYSQGNAWDLTLAAARALHFDQVGADRIGYAVAIEYARKSSSADSARR
jgi:rare lipoprotein A (peptidoglycan hydrolase)